MAMGIERAEWTMQTHAKGKWSEGAVSKSVISLSVTFSDSQQDKSGRGGVFTRSKHLGERHLVFTTFLTSAWRGGGMEEGWRWRWGGEKQRGDRRVQSKGCDDDNNNWRTGAADSHTCVCGKHNAEKVSPLCYFSRVNMCQTCVTNNKQQ